MTDAVSCADVVVTDVRARTQRLASRKEGYRFSPVSGGTSSRKGSETVPPHPSQSRECAFRFGGVALLSQGSFEIHPSTGSSGE